MPGKPAFDEHASPLLDRRNHRVLGGILFFSCLLAAPAAGSFHFMQIEQVIGGVNGDPTAQAIQLRARQAAQNLVQRGRLVARDANGENPVVVVDFMSQVTNATQGGHVLVATPNLRHYTTPAVQPDFTMTHPIPASYLAAGTLTFETDDGSFLVCRFSWGGSAYTGPTTGAQTNDNDGDFGPPVSSALPSAGTQGFLIQLAVDALSTSNAADYRLTPSAATFSNNADQVFTITVFNCDDPATSDPDGDDVCSSVDNCPSDFNPHQEDADGDGYGDACDVCAQDAGKSAAGVCGCGVPDVDANADNSADCDPVPPPDTPDHSDHGGMNGDTGTDPGDDPMHEDATGTEPNGDGTETPSMTDGTDGTMEPGPETEDGMVDTANPSGVSGSSRGGFCGAGMLPVLSISFAALMLGRLISSSRSKWELRAMDSD